MHHPCPPLRLARGLLQQRLGLAEVACISGLGRWTCQRPFPETAARCLVGNRARHKAAQLSGERGELASALRNDRLELFAQRLDQHRRVPARTDRGNDLAPVNDGGNCKIAELRRIDDIHRNAARADVCQNLRPARHIGNDRQPGTVERRWCLSRNSMNHTARKLRQRGIADLHKLRWRRDEQSQFARRFLAVAEIHDTGAFKVEEGRKLAHGAQLSCLAGMRAHIH